MRPNVKAALLICLGVVIAAVGFVIFRHREAAVVRQDGCGNTAPAYWYDPMRPSEHFDKPGKSPFMDMQLLPKTRWCRTLVLALLLAPAAGRLQAGGSGKTPFLILLGELLKQYGIPCDVLSRGYRRLTTGILAVDPVGSPRQYGDEPLLIARKLGVPVIVGEDRYAAGQLAEEKFGPRLHLLDDGFQHRRLAREFDIVLASPSDARDSLLPTGRLREPPKEYRPSNTSGTSTR